MAYSPSAPWRLLDTGVRRAAENIALNKALLEARQAELAPCTLRFLAFEPSALLGYHQSAAQELNLEYCAEQGIAIQRRMTGGGAIYMDTDQLGWEIYANRQSLGSAEMRDIARRICTAAAQGLQELGVSAQYRPRNDIEVDGRKISGTGGAFDGNALLYQGTLLLRLDVEKMLRVGRIPAEKLSDKAIASARERMTSLETLLGKAPARERIMQQFSQVFAEMLGVAMVPGELNAAELDLYRAALQEIDDPEWVDMIQTPASGRPVLHAERKFSAGMLRVNVALDIAQQRIRQVWFSGDVFVSPRRSLIDLESRLRDVLLARMPDTVATFFAERQVDMLSLTQQDIVDLLQEALRQKVEA